MNLPQKYFLKFAAKQYDMVNVTIIYGAANVAEVATEIAEFYKAAKGREKALCY